MKRLRMRKKRLLFLALNLLLALAVLAGLIAIRHLSGLLETQKEASRWRGDNELDFSQISCFIPTDDRIGITDVYAFRYAMLDKFHEAALDVDNDSTLFVDAWSTGGKGVASTSLGRGDVIVTAVGGAFFDFHPIRLLSGNYLTEGVSFLDRTIYNCFLNARKTPQSGTDFRESTMMDLYPTTLSAMGWEIPGDRLGLGTDLFSATATLAERRGIAWLNEEVMRYSQYFVDHFAK